MDNVQRCLLSVHIRSRRLECLTGDAQHGCGHSLVVLVLRKASLPEQIRFWKSVKSPCHRKSRLLNRFRALLSCGGSVCCSFRMASESFA